MQLRKAYKIGITAAIAICLLIIYIFIEPYWLRIKNITFNDKDIPANFNGLKIVFAADFHHGPTTGLPFIEHVVNKINEQNPDIVLLGGDYVYRDKKYIEPVFEVLNEIKAPLGVFAVLGNHESVKWLEITKQCMQKYDIELLDNKSKWIMRGNDRIKIGGVSNFWKDGQRLTKTMGDITEEDFSILLMHNPDSVPYIKTKNIDLVLAGHTHGGQVSLFGLWSPCLPIVAGQKLAYGWFENDYTKTYVTSGIGTVFPPIRFCMRPEIVVITFHKEMEHR